MHLPKTSSEAGVDISICRLRSEFLVKARCTNLASNDLTANDRSIGVGKCNLQTNTLAGNEPVNLSRVIIRINVGHIGDVGGLESDAAPGGGQ